MQKEKYQKYEDPNLKLAIVELDTQIDDKFIYTLQYTQANRKKEIQV